MKNLNAAFTPFLLLLFIILATACNNDPEAPSVLQLVSSSGQNYVSENRNVPGGTPVATGVYAQAPSANVNLTNFKVTYSYDTTSTPDPNKEVIYLDSTLAPDTKIFAMQVAYTPRNLANEEIWRFTITDSNNKTYRKQIRIKTTTSINTAKSTYYTYSNVLLSRLKSPENPLGDLLGLFGFASATGRSFPAYAIKQPDIASQIDLLLNSAGTQKPSLSTINSNSLVSTTLTPANFEAFTNVNAIREAYPKNTSGVTKLENLKKDQVLAFMTVMNKVGLLRIDSVYTTLDSLAFAIKVEK